MQPPILPEALEYYNEGRERGRLTSAPSLELLRTQVLLERFLPAPPARVLDVGGAAGVYASWLAGRGYSVHLVDPVPLHIEQARDAAAGSFTAALGDARSLAEADASQDAVLLFGPLYHLVERGDRLRALREARRAVRPGGCVIAAVISRYASALDGYLRGYLDRPGFAAAMLSALRTGHHAPAGRDPDLFTTTHFHTRDELSSEVTESGLTLEAIVPVQGPLQWTPGLAGRLSDPVQRQLILDTLTVIEDDSAMTGASAHLLAAARRAAEPVA